MLCNRCGHPVDDHDVNIRNCLACRKEGGQCGKR